MNALNGPLLRRAGDIELLQEIAVLPQRPHHLVVGPTAECEYGEQGRVPAWRILGIQSFHSEIYIAQLS